MAVFLYKFIVVPLASIYLRFRRKSDAKLEKREQGSNETLRLLESFRKDIGSDSRLVWFHASSMGEFEQAKPIIEKLKAGNNHIAIAVTFFSPSGYENQKSYPYADAIFYLPFDTRTNANSFVTKLKPDLAVFVRYELWLNYLTMLNKLSIPVYLICATRPGKEKPDRNPILRSFYKSVYKKFNKIFTVGPIHSDYIRDLDQSINPIDSADTRLDRIIEKVEESKNFNIIPDGYFSDTDFVIVAGSSWKQDEDIIIEARKELAGKGEFKNIIIIMVPHEPEEENLSRLKKKMAGANLLSEIESGEFVNGKDIIVDSIGKLLKLYRYAHTAHIGGAFGAGVHSVTEPAGYGIPLTTGPGMNNSPDAILLKECGALNVIENTGDYLSFISEMIRDNKCRKHLGQTASDYVYKGKGESERIAVEIQKHLKL